MDKKREFVRPEWNSYEHRWQNDLDRQADEFLAEHSGGGWGELRRVHGIHDVRRQRDVHKREDSLQRIQEFRKRLVESQ